MKVNPRRKKETMKSKLTLDLEAASIVRYVERENGTKDKFGVVRTISKDTNTPGQSRDFVGMSISEMRTGRNRNTGLNNATADPEVDNEMISSQRIKARISTSAKLPGIEEALNNVVGSIGEQNEQMSE